MDRQGEGDWVQADDHGQEEAQSSRQGVTLADCRRAFEVFSGKPAVAWIDSRFAGRFPPFSGFFVATRTVLDVLVRLGERARGLLLISDGNMSHAISLARATALPGESPRIHFMDSWGEERGSFLEPGRNLAGVRARREGGGVFSITLEEAGDVLIAMIQGTCHGWGRARRKRYDSLAGADLFQWFGLGEVGRGEAVQGLTPILCRPPKTGEHIDLVFFVDGDGLVSAASWIADLSWFFLDSSNLWIAADLAASLLVTLDAEQSGLSRTTLLEMALVLASACAAEHAAAELVLCEIRGNLVRATLDGRVRICLNVTCDW
jgi:hypothetical protein